MLNQDHALEFVEFDRLNPGVWRLFKRYALRMWNRQKRAGVDGPRSSARLIVERIRWEIHMQTKSVDGFGFKINDHYVPHYARKFLAEHPECEGFFQTRGDGESGSSAPPATLWG